LNGLSDCTVTETKRYHPFVKLANHCAAAFTPEDVEARAWFCRNDSKIVLGALAERKPDVIVADKDAIQ
jgi:hypothetical protein